MEEFFLMLNRGKDTGHDIDLLISHPEEGKEGGLLQRLLSVLEGRDMILQGRWERSTFSAEESAADALTMGKTSNLRSTLDHFEKWIGILKVGCRIDLDQNLSVADEETAERVSGKFRKTSVR